MIVYSENLKFQSDTCRCLYLPNHLLSGKDGPSSRFWGAFLFNHWSIPYAYPFIAIYSSVMIVLLIGPGVMIICVPFQIVKLYERCLIACANYCEYWIRYVLCMEASGSTDLANNALARATQIFVKVRKTACQWHFEFLKLLLYGLLSFYCSGKILLCE